jgi:hypothetical protein
MIHYDLCVEQNGPLKYLNSIRVLGSIQSRSRSPVGCVQGSINYKLQTSSEGIYSWY